MKLYRVTQVIRFLGNCVLMVSVPLLYALHTFGAVTFRPHAWGDYCSLTHMIKIIETTNMEHSLKSHCRGTDISHKQYTHNPTVNLKIKQKYKIVYFPK